METTGLPALGVHLIVGENARQYRINSARSLEDGRTAVIEALVRSQDNRSAQARRCLLSLDHGRSSLRSSHPLSLDLPDIRDT